MNIKQILPYAAIGPVAVVLLYSALDDMVYTAEEIREDQVHRLYNAPWRSDAERELIEQIKLHYSGQCRLGLVTPFNAEGEAVQHGICDLLISPDADEQQLATAIIRADTLAECAEMPEDAPLHTQDACRSVYPGITGSRQ